MGTERTRQVVGKYFGDLARGDLASAMAALADDVDFELPVDRWNAVIPYLGRHHGVGEVTDAFAMRGATTQVIDYAMRALYADGDTAVATIYTRAAHTRTGVEFEIEDSHVLTVDDDGRISHWKVYFDPNAEVAAFDADREARLITAVWRGDGELVAGLIRFGADVNHRDPDSGLTPLMIAAGRGDTALVEQLIDAGADVYAADSAAGVTALHKACQGGSLDVVRALVAAGAFVDAVAPTTGHTPLMDALWYKYPEIARFLLNHGARLNIATHYGFSLREHLAYELNVNTVGRDRLALAERYVTERSRADGAAIAGHRLMTAVTEDDVDCVRRLLAEGVDVDRRFPMAGGFNDAHTPLLVAARDGHTEIARLLLAAGADVNATEPTFGAVPLHKAVYNGHVDLTVLIANWPGADVDYQGATNGYTPLHDALWHGYEDCARALLAAGATSDRRGHDGRTPLDLAVEVFGGNHPLTDDIRARA
jgi:ankyrin repeat protein